MHEKSMKKYKDSALKHRISELKRNGLIVNLFGLLPLVWALVLVIIIAWGLNIAFADSTVYLDRANEFIIGKYTYQNFIDVVSKLRMQVSSLTSGMRYVEYGEMLWNSIVYAGLKTLADLLATIPFAYVVSRYDFRGKKFLYAFVIFQMMVPIYGTGGATYTLYNKLGMMDNIFYYLGSFTGTGMYFLITYSYFKSVPREYDEASMIDGAGPFAIFFRVMIPLAKPIITAIGAMDIIAFWNDYSTVLVYQKTHPTLSSALYVLRSQAFYLGLQTPTYFAGVFLSIIPVVVIFIMFSKQIMENMTIGGIKG